MAGGELRFGIVAMYMPTVFSDGKTSDECRKETKEALVAVVSYLLEQEKEDIIPISVRETTTI